MLVLANLRSISESSNYQVNDPSRQRVCKQTRDCFDHSSFSFLPSFPLSYLLIRIHTHTLYILPTSTTTNRKEGLTTPNKPTDGATSSDAHAEWPAWKCPPFVHTRPIFRHEETSFSSHQWQLAHVHGPRYWRYGTSTISNVCHERWTRRRDDDGKDEQ